MAYIRFTLSSVALLSLLWSACVCHPDPNPLFNSKCENASEIEFFSYHIHVLFWQQNNASYTNALKLKQEFVAAFNVNESADCNDINSTHNENPPLCIVDFDYPEPACPFLTSEWAAFVPSQQLFAQTVPWMMVNHAKYDMLNVLVHPNSGCEVYDHRDWLFWIGSQTEWQLDLSCLHWDAPGYNYYDCTQQAQVLMFENDGMNYQQYCALQINNATQQFMPPSSKEEETKFCSALCQSWIDKLLQFNKDCPSDCQLYEAEQEQTCKTYWNSLQELYDWSLYQCGE